MSEDKKNLIKVLEPLAMPLIEAAKANNINKYLSIIVTADGYRDISTGDGFSFSRVSDDADLLLLDNYKIVEE